MHTPSYLLKNSFGIYHLRLAVPKHLRHTVGKREIKKTLRTGNRREARRLATQYQDWFDEMANYDDILNNPLNKQLKFNSITTNPDGTVTAAGVELDPAQPSPVYRSVVPAGHRRPSPFHRPTVIRPTSTTRI